MPVRAREGLAYECALRVIGRHLDAEPSYHASVVERPDRFTVRWQPARHRTPERCEEFGWDKIRHLTVFQTAGRDVGRKHRRLTGLWSDFPTGQEDFFRALGFELDQDKALNVTIDEFSDHVSVAFVRPSGSRTSPFESRRLTFSRMDIDALIRSAQTRRASPNVSAS